MIVASGSQDILGISDPATVTDYCQRAIELVAYEANFDPFITDLDICADPCGVVTLPDFVEMVLATNVGGFPAFFRNGWFQFHINGPGSNLKAFGGVAGIGNSCGWCWDDKGMSPTFQDLNGWTILAAIVEDAVDGNGSLNLQVFGETMDVYGNVKDALTIPVTGPSMPGVLVPLLANIAAADPQATPFRRISRVIKPATRGYVKLIGVPLASIQNAAPSPGSSGPLLSTAPGTVIGYYGPNDVQPSYRRIRVNSPCNWVRMKCRLKVTQLVYPTDLLPVPSKQAMINLLRAVRMQETNNFDEATKYIGSALDILLKQQQIKDGPADFQIQVDPDWAVGTIDLR